MNGLQVAAIEELVEDHPEPVAARKRAEDNVRKGRCYCCGLSSMTDDPLGRCYICYGRGHGDEVLDRMGVIA